MKKVKILGIAPYEGLMQLMQQAAAKREDIEMDVFLGDLEEGAAIVSHCARGSYDVVLSRGGTAERIRSVTTLPVVDIPLSVHDIFRSIKLAENYTDKYALVGFPAITENAHFLCDMMQYHIDIYTIHNEQEAEITLQKLQEQGCSMVLCDMITNSRAKRYGLTSILITSGTESIESALNSAVQIARSHAGLRSDLSFLRLILENHPNPTIVFDEEGRLLLYTKVSELPEAVMDSLKTNLSAVLEQQEKKIYLQHAGLLYAIEGYRRQFEGKAHVLYYISQRRVPLALTKNGIRYISQEEAFDSFYNSFYGITHSATPQGMSIGQYAKSSVPLIILGEPGTAKESLARLIYARSDLRNRPMAVISFARMEEKGWSFLTSHASSPFSDTGITLYLKDTSTLTDARFAELLSIMTDLNLAKKNRILMAFSTDENGNMTARCRKALNALSCLLLEIAPLRSHLSDLPNLTSLYISSLNMKLARDVVGIEPEGIRQMQSYQWPGNYDQLERIMKELVSSAEGPYIRSGEVGRLLRREVPHATPASSLDIHRTLEEIDLDVLRLILAECGNNQSLAAKKLGISRTTLWRMLQKLEA